MSGAIVRWCDHEKCLGVGGEWVGGDDGGAAAGPRRHDVDKPMISGRFTRREVGPLPGVWLSV